MRGTISRAAPGGQIGTGPFRLVSQSSRRMLLRRVEPMPGRIEAVELRSFDTPMDAAARTLAGEADILSQVPSHMIEFFNGVPRLKVLRAQGTRAEALVFNARMLSAADRRALVDELRETDATEVGEQDGCSPMPGKRPDPSAPQSTKELRLVAFGQDPIARRMALAMRRALGVRATSLETVEPAQMIRAFGDNTVDMAFLSLLLVPRSMLAQHFHTGSPSNFYAYSDARVDEALDRGDWPAAEAAMRDNPPALWLCKPQQVAVVASQFKNARLGPYGLFETLPDWEVAQ
jgi:hypothetical protein